VHIYKQSKPIDSTHFVTICSTRFWYFGTFAKNIFKQIKPITRGVN